MTIPWRPSGADPVKFDALLDGVPPHMIRPLRQWFDQALHYNRVTLSELYDIGSRRDPAIGDFAAKGVGTLWNELLKNDEMIQFLDFLVWAKSQAGNFSDPKYVAQLESVLSIAGSTWRVGVREGLAGLEHRVPQGVQDAAESAMNSSGSAGRLLSEAWRALYGQSPDYEDAYEKAIKAVEESGAHVVCPNNAKATLGTMARDMENQKDWALPLGEDSKHPSRDVVYKMIQSLWAGQESRHGGNGYRKPTREEAESAVLIAVPLVLWFTAGTVARRP